MDWRTIAQRWASGPVAGALWDTFAARAARVEERVTTALRVLYPTAAPVDALPALAEDRLLPTFDGEEEQLLRRRLREWHTFLDEAGTLKVLARIAHAYHPTAATVVAVSRRASGDGGGGFEATSTAAFTIPVVTRRDTPFEWDSATFPTTPADRLRDVWVLVYPPTPTFAPGPEYTLGGGTVGFEETVPSSLFASLQQALAAYKPAATTIRSIVYLANSAPFDPGGVCGDWRTRPREHRYVE